MRALARRLHRGQEGITLTELLVALSVSTIIIAAVAGFFAAALRATSSNTASDSNTRRSTIVMNVLTRYVHAATILPRPDGTFSPALVTATPTELTFYAYVNLTNGTANQPVLVRYSLNGNRNLVQQQWDGTADANGFYSFPSTATTPSKTTVLGGPIAAPSADGPLFDYLDASGTSLGTLSTATLPKVRAIQVNLELGSTTQNAPSNTHIQNTLYLFNVGYSTTVTVPTP